YFLLNGVRNDCSKITYMMDSIPAFEEEEFMLASTNYQSAVYFELEQYYTTNGAKVRVTKEWRDVDRELLTDVSVGGQPNKGGVAKGILAEILAGKNPELDGAKAVFY